jgi:hypothetical protein
MTRQHIEVVTSASPTVVSRREGTPGCGILAGILRLGNGLRDPNKIVSPNRNPSCQKGWASTLTLINVLTPRGL